MAYFIRNSAIVCIVIVGLLRGNNAQTTASAALEDLVEEFWQWRLDNSPEFGTKFGINNHDDKLEQYTEEAFTQQKTEAEALRTKADGVAVDDLTLQEQVSLTILKDLLNNYIDGYAFRKYSMYNSISTIEYPLGEWRSIIGWSKFETEKNYDDYLTRLGLLPTWLDQKHALMRKAIDMKTTQPIEALRGVLEKVRAEIALPVVNSTFYGPFKNMPQNMAQAIKTRLQTDATTVVRDVVIPAWTGHLEFLENTYVPAVRPLIGASSLAGGEEYYRACLRWHLSVEMTPREIHDLGLQEVERISKNMIQIMKDDNFDGTLLAYLKHLADDKTNYYNTSDEMLQGFRDIIADAHKQLGNIMHNVPEMEISVQALDNPNGPTGRYSEPPLDNSRTGIFKANVFNPEEKPKYNMYALALHEAEPGHHTQTAITVENNVPNFRRAIEYRKYSAVPFNWLFHTAYSEGWALYAEALGEEMGVYEAKHALFGRYASEIHRAARLVVDTGMHAFNWSRSDAVEYLKNYTTLSDGSIANEIDRYISWPGQACAYKIGELRIKQLKAKSQEQLGSAFDARAFHDEVLLLGNAPMHALEDHIDNWIEENATQPPPSAAPTNILNGASWVLVAILVFVGY